MNEETIFRFLELDPAGPSSRAGRNDVLLGASGSSNGMVIETGPHNVRRSVVDVKVACFAGGGS
jgi:hypothetical protein